MSIETAVAAALAANNVPGAVALVGDAAGLRSLQAFGVRDPATAAPMTTDTVFQLASMTKAVTSVAAMQLVEAGKLSLDAPIGETVAALADPQVLAGFDEDDRPILRPARAPLTLRHLLTHTSGFGYDFVSADMARARGPEGMPAPGKIAALKATAAVRSRCALGIWHRYRLGRPGGRGGRRDNGSTPMSPTRSSRRWG